MDHSSPLVDSTKMSTCTKGRNDRISYKAWADIKRIDKDSASRKAPSVDIR